MTSVPPRCPPRTWSPAARSSRIRSPAKRSSLLAAAGRLHHRGPRAVGRPRGQPELDVAAQQLLRHPRPSTTSSRLSHRGVPVVLARLLELATASTCPEPGPGRLPHVQSLRATPWPRSPEAGVVDPQAAPGVLRRPGLDLRVPGRQAGARPAPAVPDPCASAISAPSPATPSRIPVPSGDHARYSTVPGTRGRRPGLAELPVSQQVELEHLRLDPVGQEGQGGPVRREPGAPSADPPPVVSACSSPSCTSYTAVRGSPSSSS